MADVVTPLGKGKKRAAPDGESAGKKSIKKMKNSTPPEKGISEKQKAVKKSKSEKTSGKKRGLPDGAEKENQLQKKSGPLKILKGSMKKAKSFDQKKVKPGMKRKSGDKTEEEGSSSKKVKLEQMKKKDRKEFRKKTVKNNYDLIKRTKSMWEELRRHDLDKSKREKICQELTKILKGRAKEMIFAHDTCRVVQCLMQYGNEVQRTMLFEELKDYIAEMAKSKYSKFFIRKIMKYGTKEQKNHVFVSFHGKVRKLIRHALLPDLLSRFGVFCSR